MLYNADKAHEKLMVNSYGINILALIHDFSHRDTTANLATANNAYEIPCKMFTYSWDSLYQVSE